jgi:hypothetical protein
MEKIENITREARMTLVQWLGINIVSDHNPTVSIVSDPKLFSAASYRIPTNSELRCELS